MATARRHLVDPAEGGVFHCISRCVRRAYLCGWDALSGRSFEQLLDWTGREIRAEKRGLIAADLRPVLQRLDLAVEAWAENVARYGSLFHRLAGKVSGLRDWAHAKKLARLHGHRGARLLYSEAV